jgi:hypothetical protein
MMASDVFVSQSEIESKVDLAVDLNRQIKALTKKLEELKKDITLAAASGAFPEDKKGNVVIRSGVTDNCATVSYVSNTVVFRDMPEEVIITNLKGHLPQSWYSGLFLERIKFSDSFKGLYNLMPQNLRTVVDSYVEEKPMPPRVLLSK